MLLREFSDVGICVIVLVCYMLLELKKNACCFVTAILMFALR